MKTLINSYEIVPYKNDKGFKILVETSEGRGNLTRNVNQFRISFPGQIHKVRIGYTHPDFNLCKQIFNERADVLRNSRNFYFSVGDKIQ